MKPICIWAPWVWLVANVLRWLTPPGLLSDALAFTGTVAIMAWMVAAIGLMVYDRSRLRWLDKLLLGLMAATLIYAIGVALVGD